MSSQVQDQSWASSLLARTPPSLVNFLARRRIAISLIGFTSLVLFNVFGRQTVPYNPFAVTEPMVAVALVMMMLGLAIRSWSAGTLNKSRELTTHGPYAVTRNPLYWGSFLMMFSFCLLCKDWPTLIFVAGPMAMLYRMQVLFEEQRLERLFGAQWLQYRAQVPRFGFRWPTADAFRGWTTFEWMRNREYRGLAATAIGLAAVFAWHWYHTR